MTVQRAHCSTKAAQNRARYVSAQGRRQAPEILDAILVTGIQVRRPRRPEADDSAHCLRYESVELFCGLR